MSAPTTLHELHQVISTSPPPLSEEVLSQARTILIQKSSSPPGKLSISPDATSHLLTSLLLTVSHPTLLHAHRACAADTLSAFLIRSRTTPHLSAAAGGQDTARRIADAFLAWFDDASSGLTKALKDLLSNALAVFLKCGEEQEEGGLLEYLARRGLEGLRVGEGRKGGFYVLEMAVKRGFSAAKLSEVYGGGEGRLVADMIRGLLDRNLGPAVGKAVVAVLRARRKEVTEEHAWVESWLGQMKDGLGKEELRGKIAVYILPGLLAVSRTGFESLVGALGLKEDGGVGEEHLGALLCVLKVGKDLAFVGEIGDDGEAEKGKPPVVKLRTDLIAPLLVHALPHVRVSALNLVVHSPAITRTLSPASLELLRSALPHLHAESDAEVRDLVIGGIRDLTERLACSSYAAEKELRNLQKKMQRRPGMPPSPADINKMLRLDSIVVQARDFCRWYSAFLITLIRPGSNYQRTIMGLRALTFLIRSGVDASLADFAFETLPGGGSVASNGEHLKKGLFKWPEFAKELRVFSEEMKRVLLEAMFNPFDDVRSMSAEVLRFDNRWDRGEVIAFLERGIAEMNECGRAADADGVARALVLVFELVRRGDMVFLSGDRVWGLEIETIDRGLGVVRWILAVMEREYIAVAAADFQRAVRERPVHGLFLALKLVLEMKGIYAAKGDAVAWTEVHGRIFKACDEIWRLTKAPLCFDSPEGHVPDDIEGEDEDMDTQTVMSYSWRAIKESSALLGTVLGGAALGRKDFDTGGKLLLQQLADIRHRGAFSAVSPSFMALCTRCFRSTDLELQELPRIWLKSNMDLILSKSSAITRRSAGLPYLIIGVLASEADPKRPLLHSTIHRFFEIAALPAASPNDGEKMDLPQVHALNCLKFLFTHTRMSQPVVPFIGSGLSLAVSCFGSEIWAIRNCGVMLFTALANRLFGTRRSRNDYTYTASTFTTSSFFAKYESARGVLLKNLKEKVGGLEGGDSVAVEMVYPALSLIARLDVDTSYDMIEFRELIETCMRSRIWKVREMAARALSAIVGPAEVVDMIRALMQVGVSRQNVLHGNLCAVRVLLERRVTQAVGVYGEDNTWRTLAIIFAGCFDELVVRNRCSVTKATYLQVITPHLAKLGALANTSIFSYCADISQLPQELNNSSFVGRTLFKQHLASFLLTRSSTSTTANTLLELEDEELTLFTLHHLITLSTPPPVNLQPLWDIVTISQHPTTLTAALQLLHTLLTVYPNHQLPAPDFHQLLPLLGSPSSATYQPALPLLATITLSPNPLLLPHLTTATAENSPLPLRRAALSALRSTRLPAVSEAREDHLPLFLALHTLLHDDDEEVRAEAAGLVPHARGLALLPMAASETLLSALVARFPESPVLARVAVAGVTGSVANAAKGAGAGAGAGSGKKLFERERGNLWIDDVLVAGAWGRVLRGMKVGGEVRMGLKNWVEEAEGVVGVPGGLLGEEAWRVMGRVEVARSVLEVWGRGT